MTNKHTPFAYSPLKRELIRHDGQGRYSVVQQPERRWPRPLAILVWFLAAGAAWALLLAFVLAIGALCHGG